MPYIILFILFYILYRIIKNYFSRKIFNLGNKTSNYRTYTKPSHSNIDEKDIIDADFVDIEVKKGNSEINKE